MTTATPTAPATTCSGGSSSDDCSRMRRARPLPRPDARCAAAVRLRATVQRAGFRWLFKERAARGRRARSQRAVARHAAAAAVGWLAHRHYKRRSRASARLQLPCAAGCACEPATQLARVARKTSGN
eukprot:scaffold1017_cov374-Prasinococcus_capsulatus_cf.AAC.27